MKMDDFISIIQKTKREVQSTKSISTVSETASISGESYCLSKTVIIFDFDDTLFCTKYFDTYSLSYQDIFSCKVSLDQINPCLAKELQNLQSAIIELFTELHQNSFDTIIISNADMKWINNCLVHFLSEFNEYIKDNDIKIYSAKNIFSNLISNAFLWKLNCFEKVILDNYINNEKVIYKEFNLISIGDGKDEKKAVFKLNHQIQSKLKFKQPIKINPKFIQMISCPSATSIIMQLEHLRKNILELINSNNNLFKMVLEIKNQVIQIKCYSSASKLKEANKENFGSFNSNNTNTLDEDIISNKDDFNQNIKRNLFKEFKNTFVEQKQKIKLFNKCLGRKHYLYLNKYINFK